MIRALLLFFLISATLQAETKNIYGIDFHYDSIKKIDDQQIEISIAKQTEIITKEQLDYHLANKFLSDHSHKIDFQSLNRFYKQALLDKNYQLATLAIRYASSQSDWTINNADSFFSVYDLDFYRQIAREDQKNDNFINKDSLFGLYYLFITRDYYPKVYVLSCCSNSEKQFEILKYVILRDIKQNISSKEISQILSYFEFLLNQSNQYQELKNFIDLFFLSTNDASSFFVNYQRLHGQYPEYCEEINQKIEELRIKFLEYAIKSDQIQVALDLLMLVDFDKNRSESTHEQVLKILSSVDLNSSAVLLIDPYSNYLTKISSKDKRIKDKIIDKNIEMIMGLFERDQAFAANDYIKNLFLYRPNPNKLNRDLLFKQIKIFHKKGMRQQVNLSRQTSPVSFSLSQKIWFFKNAYYFSLWWILAFIVLLILLPILIWSKNLPGSDLLKRYLLNTADSDDGPRGFRDFADDTLGKQFNSLSSNWQKYKSLLKNFDLKPGVSAEEIKSTYRQKIKEYHPDLNPDQDEKAHNKFLELTEKYDELLKIHEIVKKRDKLNSSLEEEEES